MTAVTPDRHLRLVHPSGAVRPARAVRSLPRSRPRSHLRLTRRGRFLALLVVVLAVLIASVWAAQTVRASSSAEASPTRYVAVERGDTVWKIARHLDMREDVRDTVQRILELNGLGSAVLHPGQLLVVPAS